MASSRPHRKCVRRLSQDAINEILSDFSDPDDDPDDPDYQLDPDMTPKVPRVATKRLRPTEFSDSSNDSVQSAKKTNDSVQSAKKTNDSVQSPKKTPDVPKQQVPTGTIFTVLKPGFNTTGVDIMQHTPTDEGDRYVCCVKDCPSGGLSNLDGLWLFPLPEESESRELWIRELPIILDANRPNSPRVCFRHFDSSKFVKRQQRLLGLLKDAVPSAKAAIATSVSSNSNSKHARARVIASKSFTPNQAPNIVKPVSAHSTASRGRLAIAPASAAAAGNKGQSSSALTPNSEVSSSVVSSSVHVSKAEIFIDLTSEEAMMNDGVGNGGSSMAGGDASSATADGAELTENAGGVDDDAYELTLEDIEEELPWVVPDMHWDSTLKDEELHLVWNNSPDQNRCKKVVLDKGLAARVYVGEKEVVLGVKKVTTIESLKALFIELGEL
ncbi:hypothetical protein V5799_008715 [Amblyomma americanum]|uniref:THAP-type domain-containing protein n=1 Tax=Amblyomma americanum TaxID=6943 RepID=A0AAQ4FCN2_AMBAM